MTPVLHQRVRTAFLHLRTRPPGERAALLDTACGDDAELRAAVEALLAADADGGGHLDTRVMRSAAEGLATGWADSALGHPERIGAYRIQRVLGVGGMGVVYLAEQERPTRVVALKVLRAGIASPGAARRFERESQVLARLHHPGIAQVYEAGAADTGEGPRLFFAMEFVEGAPLTEHLRAAPLGTRERVLLFTKVCDAVHHAHERGVIHRDLKPANILVDAGGAPKVLDFGVARSIDSGPPVTSMNTDAGQLIGTLAYMSPEQAAGDSARLDARSDVYSLGVVLYEVLAGRLPYQLDRRAIPDAVRLIREQDAAPLSSISRVFRGDLETICARAMEKDPDRRYQSAADLAADLHRHLNAEPIVARPPSAAYQVSRFARRNRVLVAGVAAVFVVLCAGIAATSLQTAQAVEQRDRAESAETLAQRRLEQAEAILAFLSDRMLSSVSPGAAQGRVVTVREVLDNAAAEIEGQFEGKPLVEASIRLTLGRTYMNLGEYAGARPHLEAAYALRRSALGAEHLDTLVAAVDLARVNREQGRLAEAEKILVGATEALERTMGALYRKTLMAKVDLASLYNFMGRRDEAEPLMRMALEQGREVFPADDVFVMAATNNLGAIYRDSGRLDLAEPLWVESYGLRRRVMGDDHPDTLATLSNLALAMGEQERWEEAMPLQLQVMEGTRRVLGPDHPRTYLGIANVGLAYWRQSLLEEAEPLLIEAVDGLQRTLGIDHAQTLTIMTGLAQLQHRRGKFAAAEPVQALVVQGMERTLGAGHPDLVAANRGLATVLRDLGRLDEADAILAGMMDGMRARGEPEASMHIVHAELGMLRRDQGRYDEGANLLAESVPALRLQRGREDSGLAIYVASLGDVLRLQGKLTEGEALLTEAMEMARGGPRDARRLGRVQAWRGRCLAAMGRAADAESSFLEAHALLSEAWGESHPTVLGVAADLAELLRVAGRTEEAAAWQRRAGE